jgi:protein AIR1/2
MITGPWCLQVAGIVRYFEKQEEDTSKATKVVCKHCGAKGEHKTFECPILIVSAPFLSFLARLSSTRQCLTCGARDEHSTRSCPISKTCFNCGLKGHVAQVRPSRCCQSRVSGPRPRLELSNPACPR